MKPSEHEIYMETNRLAVLATTAIERAMKRAELSRSQLADALEVPRSRVTKVLDGETNMTLKTLASFGLACGVRWQLVGLGTEDGSLAVGWRGVELKAATASWAEVTDALERALAGVQQYKELPMTCSALEASQDPIGPLLPLSDLQHVPSFATSFESN